MSLVAVRRVNEWDGPSMLKIYAPFTGTPAAPEKEAPDLQAYIQRIDTYTYGLGWLLCEVDCHPVGFAHLTENRLAPKDLFSVEFQLYVAREWQRKGVGAALWSLMRDIMEEGDRRRVLAYFNRENAAAQGFFSAMGFTPQAGGNEAVAMYYSLSPRDPEAERPTKPYLIDKFVYEAARERAAGLVRAQ